MSTFFMSKSVSDVELPKILSYNEPAIEIVKDICVDSEGLQKNEVKKGQLMPEIEDFSANQKSTPSSNQSPRRSGRKSSLADLFAEEREFDTEERQLPGQTYQPVDLQDETVNQAEIKLEEVNLSLSEEPNAGKVGPTEATAYPSTFGEETQNSEIEQSEEDETQRKEVNSRKVGSTGATVHPLTSERESQHSEIEPSEEDGSQRKEVNVGKVGSNGGAVHPLISERESQLSEIENEEGGSQRKDGGLLGPSVLTGGVMYSGHLLYSGSSSLRSESSMTSGRSFAFPVLQTEWNSSPVRMGRVERRRYRRRGSWHSSLFCCKS